MVDMNKIISNLGFGVHFRKNDGIGVFDGKSSGSVSDTYSLTTIDGQQWTDVKLRILSRSLTKTCVDVDLCVNSRSSYGHSRQRMDFQITLFSSVPLEMKTARERRSFAGSSSIIMVLRFFRDLQPVLPVHSS